MMAFLHDDKRHAWFIGFIDFLAGRSNLIHFVVTYLVFTEDRVLRTGDKIETNGFLDVYRLELAF
jgi:hypothetical protein